MCYFPVVLMLMFVDEDQTTDFLKTAFVTLCANYRLYNTVV